MVNETCQTNEKMYSSLMAFAVNGCAHGHACQGRSETLPQCPERLTSLFPARIERNSWKPQRDCVDTINMLDEYGHFYTCLLNFPVGHLLVWMFPLSQVLEDVFLITRLLSFCALFWGKDSIPTWIPGASLVREEMRALGSPSPWVLTRSRRQPSATFTVGLPPLGKGHTQYLQTPPPP